MISLPILLVGAGGHAASCIDVIEQEGRYSIVGLIGCPSESGACLLGYEVIGTDKDLPGLLATIPNALIAVGQIKTPEPRISMFEQLQRIGYQMPIIVSPHAYVSQHANLGKGTIVMHGAIVNACARVGENCIINSQSLVEHDALVEDHCHVATAATINGGARVGSGTFVGSGSSIREQVSVGNHCFIGMGAQVTEDCETGTRVSRTRK